MQAVIQYLQSAGVGNIADSTLSTILTELLSRGLNSKIPMYVTVSDVEVYIRGSITYNK